jgi:ABC-type glutathione transport system ATPase component
MSETTNNPGTAPLLVAEHVVKEFGMRRTLLERATRQDPPPAHRAVDDVSLTLHRGEILGVAGGSGSGKTTFARCLIRLVEPDGGTVTLDGQDVRAAEGGDLRELRRRMQMIFQDPYASLNPRMTVGDAILEAGRVHGRPGSEDGDAFVRAQLEQVHLSPTLGRRKPRELSGGQRQRVAVARALAVGPELLIADEAVSALDVSVQAQLLNMFLDLRDELGVAILFVAHQLAVIAEVADRVAIMRDGRLVEEGETAVVFGHPQHEYTKSLLSAHPRPDLHARELSAKRP